jgi:hypothetical protein
VLALALVVVGLRPPVRAVWWPLVLLPAWFAGPALTATAYLEPLLRPGAGLPDTLPDSLAGARQVFWAAASTDARDLAPWVTAVVAGLVVSAALAVPREAQPDPVPAAG